ncbi:hypothetical protein [Devosia sediminis]|uniref:Uncharacterized protein n=1 Tax=Devosia sediminis TaxID=2798801 RepID=A0A934IWD7_9HYPH|nr:hypothetical protein [Devosia sediminis]MBJ3784018.1 hypothetical protein [Devosia sediminis]
MFIRVVTGIAQHLDVRIPEWIGGIGLILWGMNLILTDTSWTNPQAWSLMLSITSEDTWGLICVVAGGLWLLALTVNGTFADTAYPVGEVFEGCLAWIAPYTPVYNSWKWVVSWDGWFGHSGVAESKQAAADAATNAWWRLVQTDVPRDVDFDATRIVAQILVRPMPNSLFGEDGPFLQSLHWHLTRIFHEELAAGTAPAVVLDLARMLGSEIERRHEGGELKRPVQFTPQKMRRRRR